MPISTHVLDVALGRPAGGIDLALCAFEEGEWIAVSRGITDGDGRCKDLLPPSRPIAPGVYRIRFETRGYFERMSVESLHPFVEIAFEVRPDQGHYHIPLLLTANGYTTYRGS